MTDDGMVRYLLDQLEDDSVTARTMFGGHGIYRDGRMFGLVYDGTVYMKVTPEEAARSDRPPFQPDARRTFPTFRQVPADELEDRTALADLTKKAQQAARAK